ncbi:MAG TPA: fused MFS/spermidine synthase, partial [Pyrinomonadaceae bacterium]|nr:fused MFS/spermidine synthase [Pyrinomonadaceae bacterium]
YFYLEEGTRLRAHVEDGRGFIRRAREKYDLVVLDAYTIGGQIPFHLTTREFFGEVKAALSPGGVLLANVNGSLEGRRSRVVRSEYKTLAGVFEGVHVFPLPEEAERGAVGGRLDPSRRRNVILVAADGAGAWGAERAGRAAEELVRRGVVRVPTFAEDARRLLEGPLRTDDVPVLTDDYAPVDTMVF